MTIQNLIERLSALPQDAEIMVLDSSNGGGSPREINLGPVARVVTEEDAAEVSDCEEVVGKTIYVMGFGCY